MSDKSLLSLAHSCPRCHEGPLFKTFMEIHRACSSCGLEFEQETGQHWGAMVFSYALGALIAFPIFLGMMIARGVTLWALAVPVAVLAVVAPLNVRVSRLIWTHAMYHLHVADKQKQ